MSQRCILRGIGEFRTIDYDVSGIVRIREGCLNVKIGAHGIEQKRADRNLQALETLCGENVGSVGGRRVCGKLDARRKSIDLRFVDL